MRLDEPQNPLVLERQLRAAIARKDAILRRIAHTHMHYGHCAWCDSDVHERDCFVAAAIAETSSESGGSNG